MFVGIIIVCLLVFEIEIYLGYYLICKIIKHHSFTLKDTSVYPIIILIAATIIIIGRFYYTDAKLMEGIGASLKGAVSIVAMSLDSELVSLLIQIRDVPAIFLLVAYIGIYVLSGCALLSISISLVFVTLVNKYRRIKNLLCKNTYNEINYVFGFNEDCKEYIKNYCDCYIKNKEKNSSIPHRMIYVIDNSTLNKHEEEKFFLHKYGTPYIEMPYGNDIEINKTLNKLNKKGKNIKFITFFDDDKQNLNFVDSALHILDKDNRSLKEKSEFIIVANIEQDRFLTNMIYKNKVDRKELGLDDECLDIDIKDSSNGKIRIVNKYDLISYEFVKNHNFAKYIPLELLDKDLTVKDSDINLYVLGFGKVNQAVLRDVLICNQFVEKITSNNKTVLAPKRMNVKIYDQKQKVDCFELINGIFKYNKNSYNANNSNYLDLPEDYISHIKIESNSSIFADDFVKNLFDEINTNCKKKNQINYFVISIDSDFANSDIAVKLRNNFNHIRNEKYRAYNTYFIRTKENEYDVKYGINGFGSNKEVLIYNNVVGTHTLEVAKKLHNKYEEYINSSKDWDNLTPIKKISNIYSVFALYFKLTLLCRYYKSDKDTLYDINDLKNIANYYKVKKTEKIEDFKSVVDISNYDNIDYYPIQISNEGLFDLRDIFAFIEHEKWNAFELSQGVLPMSLSYSESSSLLSGRIVKNTEDGLYHLALASNLGLRQYYFFVSNLKYKLASNKISVDDAYADIIKYDYDHMDMIVKDLEENMIMIDIYNELIEYLNNKN